MDYKEPRPVFNPADWIEEPPKPTAERQAKQPVSDSPNGANQKAMLTLLNKHCPSDAHHKELFSFVKACHSLGFSREESQAFLIANTHCISPESSYYNDEQRMDKLFNSVYSLYGDDFGKNHIDLPPPENHQKPNDHTSSQKQSKTVERETRISDNLTKVLKVRERLREVSTQEVVFSPPIFTQHGEPVIWQNAITFIQGQTGAHKSRLAELFGSVVIAKQRPSGDSIGIERKGGLYQNFALCYVDSERNLKEQFPYAIQQIKQRAGFSREQHPDNFDYISLMPIPRTERFETLDAYLKQVRERYEEHVVVILDVLSDCVRDFNDPKDSLQLIDLLNMTINDYNVSFICVIHENPGSVKARGHLGTEGLNKSTTSIQVGYVRDPSTGNPSEFIEMKYLKRRFGKPGLSFYMQFDEQSKQLVEAADGKVSDLFNRRKQKADVEAMKETLVMLLVAPMERQLLLDALEAEFHCGERTIESRLKQLIENSETLYIADERSFILNKSGGNGKKVMYSLVELPPDEPLQN